MDTSRRVDIAIALGAFGLGCARAVGLPATSDASFLLTRAGNSLLRFSLDAYAVPPGGTGAPPLGAAVTAAGAWLATDPEAKILVSAAVLLGLAAAVVARTLAHSFDRPAALVGVALVLLPPYFVTSFTRHPDAGLGGVLIVAAIAARLRGASAVRAAAPAWLGVLATPWALPAALAIQLADPGSLRRVSAWLMPAAVCVILAVLSAPLPEISRGQIVGSIFGAVGVPFAGFGSTLGAVRGIWIGGLLLAVPAALSFRFAPAAIRVPWLATLAAMLVFARPGGFAAGSAVLVPSTALLLAAIAARFPDSQARPDLPRRPLLLAMLLPVLLLVIFSGADRRERDAVRRAAARDSQVAVHLWEKLEEPGPLLATRRGALAALTERAVLPVAGGLVPPWPIAVVFPTGIVPGDDSEQRILEDPRFLAAWAPWEFDRTTGRADGVWRLVRAPDATPVPADYARAVAEGFRQLGVSRETARTAFATAALLEPAPLGLAHERLAILLEAGGLADSSATAFEIALRDPWTARARGHLADRLLSAGAILRADTLLARAREIAPSLAEVRGTSARLYALAQDGSRALAESEAAVSLAPTDARVLVNHGTLLWAAGRNDAAREFWRRARHLDGGVVRFLGDFEAAADTTVAPPLVPLFSRVGFLEDSRGGPISGDGSSSAPPPPNRR